MLSHTITALLFVGAVHICTTSAASMGTRNFDVATVEASSTGTADGLCLSPRVRKSWQSLATHEKKAYINAELCLMELSADLGIRGAKTKFDELQSAHTMQTEIIHWVGQFLPWHRYFVHVHEHQLRKLCGYKGAQPYWDEIQDANNFINSELFDPNTGFGGDGVAPSGCISNGPFADYMVAIGSGYTIQPNCITRNITAGTFFQQAVEPVVINSCLDLSNFVDFWQCIEAGPHAAGHAGTNGLMIDPIASPGDPLFYMHHAFLDKVWANWQDQNPLLRYHEVGGNNHINLSYPYALGTPIDFEGLNITLPPKPLPSYNGTNAEAVLGAIFHAQRPADVPAPQVYGDAESTTTLSHVLHSYGIVPDAIILDVMVTKGAYLCYEYDT